MQTASAMLPFPAHSLGLHAACDSRLARTLGPSLQREKQHYWQHGYQVVRGLFAPEEMALVRSIVLGGRVPITSNIERVQRLISKGEHPGFQTVLGWLPVTEQFEDASAFSMLTNSDKVLDRTSCYYDDDVYPFHNKIMLKMPGFPGFRPHQDHSYWKSAGGLRFPQTGAVYIALEESTEENGCLQVMPKSHLLGTLPHSKWSGGPSDTGVTKEVWDGLLKDGHRSVPIPLQAGDALFFHGNTIHTSGDNLSNRSRLAMIVTINTRNNPPDPKINMGYPCYVRQLPRVRKPITAADLSEVRPMPEFNLSRAKAALVASGCREPGAIPVGKKWQMVNGRLELVDDHSEEALRVTARANSGRAAPGRAYGSWIPYIEEIERAAKKLRPQPDGIAFAPDGGGYQGARAACPRTRPDQGARVCPRGARLGSRASASKHARPTRTLPRARHRCSILLNSARAPPVRRDVRRRAAAHPPASATAEDPRDWARLHDGDGRSPRPRGWRRCAVAAPLVPARRALVGRA